jgi:hypothetical protein
METEEYSLFDLWIEKWKDLGEFKIFPIMDSPTKTKQQDK